MKATKIFLSLGSNLGDRKFHIEKSLAELSGKIGKIMSKSSLYETQAWGKRDQPDYYNVVVEMETLLTPERLLAEIQKIEVFHKRERKSKWEARTMDIDILFYGSEIIRNDLLCIPHPELIKRNFVLVPLEEIAGEFIHPIENQTIVEIMRRNEDILQVKKISDI